MVVAVKLNLCLLALDQEGAVQFYDKTEDMEIKIPLHDLQEQMKLIFFPQVSVQSFDYNRNGEIFRYAARLWCMAVLQD